MGIDRQPIAGSGQFIGRLFVCTLERMVWPIATSLLLLALVIMIAEALGRSILSHSFIWSEESVRFLLVWMVFLGFGLVGVRQRHLNSDLVVRHMPPLWRRSANIFSNTAGLLFCTLLLIGSIMQFRQLWASGMTTESIFDVPMWAIFVVVPVGALLFGLFYLLKLVGALPDSHTNEIDYSIPH